MLGPSAADGYVRLLSALSVVEDPRSARGRLHTLSDVLAIVVLATLCGCDNAEEFEEWGRKEEAWLKDVLSLDHGIPSQDTYLRMLAALDPEQFRAAFLQWVKQVFAPLGITGQLAIDGKTLRGSRSAAKHQDPVHMVSALLCESGLVMGQVRTADKSNEIVAIPEVLNLLLLQGALVSIDAMGCQRDIAQHIVEQGGDYLLQVKDNQPTLRSEVSTLFTQATAQSEGRPLDSTAPKLQWHEQTDGEHGRIEVRKTAVCEEFPEYFSTKPLWHSLSCVVMVEATRYNTTTKHSSNIERRYYISSRTLTAEQAAGAVRAHWLIENQLHWVLDTTFNEDACTVRAHNGAENLAVVRHFAYNLLRRCRDKKSIRLRQRRCDWDRAYRLRLLQAQG